VLIFSGFWGVVLEEGVGGRSFGDVSAMTSGGTLITPSLSSAIFFFLAALLGLRRDLCWDWGVLVCSGFWGVVFEGGVWGGSFGDVSAMTSGVGGVLLEKDSCFRQPEEFL